MNRIKRRHNKHSGPKPLLQTWLQKESRPLWPSQDLSKPSVELCLAPPRLRKQVST